MAASGAATCGLAGLKEHRENMQGTASHAATGSCLTISGSSSKRAASNSARALSRSTSRLHSWACSSRGDLEATAAGQQRGNGGGELTARDKEQQQPQRRLLRKLTAGQSCCRRERAVDDVTGGTPHLAPHSPQPPVLVWPVEQCSDAPNLSIQCQRLQVKRRAGCRGGGSRDQHARTRCNH